MQVEHYLLYPLEEYPGSFAWQVVQHRGRVPNDISALCVLSFTASDGRSFVALFYPISRHREALQEVLRTCCEIVVLFASELFCQEYPQFAPAAR